jgi:hypothetical protein
VVADDQLMPYVTQRGSVVPMPTRKDLVNAGWLLHSMVLSSAMSFMRRLTSSGATLIASAADDALLLLLWKR